MVDIRTSHITRELNEGQVRDILDLLGIEQHTVSLQPIPTFTYTELVTTRD